MGENEGSRVVIEAPETIVEARKMLAELTRKFLAGEISEDKLRAATYATNGLGKLLVHEKAAELEKRIGALEKARGAK